MPSTAKKKYTVVTAHGETEEVECTRIEAPDGVTVNFYDGDDIVASFRGYTSFSLHKE